MVTLVQDLKTFISEFTYLSKDVLHVYAGVLFTLLWMLIFKDKKKWLCIGLLVVFALINELLDISHYFEKSKTIAWAESISDIFNTVFLPLLLIVSVNLKPKWAELINRKAQ